MLFADDNDNLSSSSSSSDDDTDDDGDVFDTAAAAVAVDDGGLYEEDMLDKKNYQHQHRNQERRNNNQRSSSHNNNHTILLVEHSSPSSPCTPTSCIHNRNHNSAAAASLPIDAHRMTSCPACRDALFPFRPSRDALSHNAFWDNAAMAWGDGEVAAGGGLLDILLLVNEQDNLMRIPTDLARDIVHSTTRKLRDLKSQLMEAGLLRHTEQNFAAESVRAARIVAPFDAQELQVGRLLGTGGFSSVSAVRGFTLRPRTSRRALSNNEELSRNFLVDHASVHPLSNPDHHHDSTSSNRATETSANCLCRSAHTASTTGTTQATTMLHDPFDHIYGDPYARYAIKHLRPSLLSQSPEKFHRAAVDLVLEGQLLMVLDHPNIVSIRGWSADGPKAYQSGIPSDYFLIIDRLPQTLDDAMATWRSQVTKYRYRWRRATRRENIRQRIASWFLRPNSSSNSSSINNNKRRPSHSASSTDPKSLTTTTTRTMINNSNHSSNNKQQMMKNSGPHKFVMKLQAVLVEQLKAACSVANAVTYMHSKRLIHRDIKSTNIGFDIHGEVKLFDLGLARLLPRSKISLMMDSNSPNDSSSSSGDDDVTAMSHREAFPMSRVGTKFYMSPEVIRNEPYGTPADVYSTGVVLWEIFALSSQRDYYRMRRDQHELAERRQRRNRKLTNDFDFPALRRALKEGHVGTSAQPWLPMCDCWPAAIRTLISACLSHDPNDRPTMQQVCNLLEEELERASATLLDGGAATNAAHPHVVPRRRSTFRIDLSHLHVVAAANNNGETETASQEGDDG
jgi:serine/threonine protein kinase